MSAFQLDAIPLQGLNLIEASAGTGKTYTLAELYCRLVIEQGLSVKEILVVTFTRAATEELRDRLRRKLVEARDALNQSTAAHNRQYEHDELEVLQQRLWTAIQHFDEAAIYTIHGFCQRVLRDFAFECGHDFDLTLIGDDLTLLQACADDFWRRHIASMDDRFFTAYLIEKKQSPERLLESVKSRVGQSYLHILPVGQTESKEIISAIEQQYAALKQCWESEQDAVKSVLYQDKLLKRNSYNVKQIAQWLVQMEAFLSHKHAPTSMFDKFEKFTLEQLTKGLLKDKTLPPLAFWAACSALYGSYQQLQSVHERQLQALRLQLLNALNEYLPELKQQQRVQSYHDLLLNLEHALSGEQGDMLAKQLRQRYPAALIDEFQDTDPIQYRCFDRIYATSGLPVFFVGDPKQAIYSFRGADIFTYLKAKSQAEQDYTLTTNWRSQSALVQAVNTLFSRQASPFIYHDIPFMSVAAQRDASDLSIAGETTHAAFQFRWVDGEGKVLTKATMTEYAAADTANQIAHLLNLSQQGKATIFCDQQHADRPLEGGDIAVLVRNHHQAQAIQSQLQQRGVNSVQHSRESVFASIQATVLLRNLAAIAEPGQIPLVTAALATPIWGLDAETLYRVKQDESQWQQKVRLFQQLYQIWRQQGWMPMYRHWMLHAHAHQHLLRQIDGERWLTNLNHLAELVQQDCDTQDHPEAVLNWLKLHIQDARNNQGDETAQIRLESDEQLVRIITVHKSKGLEYPLVFCPFLWDVKLKNDRSDVVSFYDADSGQIQLAFSEPALSIATEKARQESQAEERRLLYVALTRARERCIVTWGPVKGIDDAALFALLHPQQQSLDSDAMRADIVGLVQAQPTSFSFDEVDEQVIHYRGSRQRNQRVWQARSFSGQILPPWRIGGFTSLSQHHEQNSMMSDDEPFQPEQATNLPDLAKSEEENRDRFSFPRGAQAGLCLHSILEMLDFSDIEDSILESLVTQNLLRYGFDEAWIPLVNQWIRAILATPLDGDRLALNCLSASKCLKELGFYFPVTQLSVTGLQAVCQPYLSSSSSLHTVLQHLRFSDLVGFMTGVIDLVFEDKGRFYIVDYKSNFLGKTAGDYRGTKLQAAMMSHDYPLQYLIYTVALHRYLQHRLPQYEPEKHLGGVYYLFLRGMDPQWGEAGIVYDRPELAMIQALDQYLQGGEVDG